MGTVMYNSERNSLELDEHELQNGDKVDIFVFGYWIPGQIALDTSGWHLLTRHCAPNPTPGQGASPCMKVITPHFSLVNPGHGQSTGREAI